MRPRDCFLAHPWLSGCDEKSEVLRNTGNMAKVMRPSQLRQASFRRTRSFFLVWRSWKFDLDGVRIEALVLESPIDEQLMPEYIE